VDRVTEALQREPTRDVHRRRRPSGEPPPLPRQLNVAAIAWLLAFIGWALIWAWVFFADAPAIWITERDLELMSPIVENRAGWLTPTMKAVNKAGTHWFTPVIGWITLIGALATKRIRHATLLVTSLVTIGVVATAVMREIDRPRPLGVTQIGDWEGFAHLSRPSALLTGALVAAGLTLIPLGPWRRRWYWATTAAVVLFGFAQIYTGVDHPSDVFAGATVGVAVTLVLYRSLAPEAVFPIRYGGGNTAHLDVTGVRGEAIRKAMRRQMGVEVTDVSPVGLEGSAGSTPLRIVGAEGEVLFAKLYASSHLRSDRSYKLGRTLLYGRLEDEQRYTSVRRLIQHEDYMLYVLRSADVDTQEPYAVVEITPDREYLLVTEFLEGAVEISEADVTEEIIDQGLELIKNLWRAGLAHRDVKPSNVMVQGGRLRIIDVAFAQVRPSPWRQAVDLANMMLVLALGSSPELVYERALLVFTEDEIAEAFAASRGVTLPSQLRSGVRHDGRELLGRFRELAPDRELVSIQRWSLRRVGLTIWVGFVGAFLVAAFVSNLSDIGLA
jgi:tRNA A-37 threonylcarbamoyl transferase component Bud32